jgi:hypothetical protein
LAAGTTLWAACGDDDDDENALSTASPGVLVAETATASVEHSPAATSTPTRVIQAVEATPSPAPADQPATWDGTYQGTVTWDCGGGSRREGTLSGQYVVTVEGAAARLVGENTVVGSCAGTGSLTTPISLDGQRTAGGFTFPAALWGRPGDLLINVTGRVGTGTLEGPIPGPAVIQLRFEVRAR